jgi:hypothetical protein
MVNPSDIAAEKDLGGCIGIRHPAAGDIRFVQ